LEAQKLHKIPKKLLSTVLAVTFFASIFAFVPSAEAHILIIGDSNNYDEASKVGKVLKDKGYKVLELYKENATTKKIIKGMYNADAVIYAGHGGYQSGNYDGNGGTAKAPFALVGTDNNFIWGIGGQMRLGSNGKLFTAPFKKNIPVILLHTCFSTGWAEDKEVANPTETIYNFAKMFNGAGANYYATGWNGAEIVYDFLNGATSFSDANSKNYERITKYATYNGIQVWRNDHGMSAFVGNWSSKFPTAAQTTAYNDSAAEKWYNSYVISTTSSARPDLTVTSAYKSGGYLYVTVKNQGTSISGACYTRASYNSYYKDIYTYALKPGENKIYQVSFTYTHGTVSTDYYNTVLESNGNNNVKTF
jgi:hypothetical protein